MEGDREDSIVQGTKDRVIQLISKIVRRKIREK